MPKTSQRKRVQVRVGGFSIVVPSAQRGRVWLMNAIGEGMDVPVRKFEKCLAEFFRREF